MARDKKIRLTFYPEVKELVMDFDAEKMQHIVYNLLSNAIKFTSEEGKVILHLREVEVKGQRWLQTKVSDTGKGIEEKELPHIFDRFYQVENTGGDSNKEKTYSGTGIGLALSKELVELMGGQIVVESKLGSGTDFMILLPVKNQSEMKEENFVAKGFSTEKKEVFESTAGSPAPAFQWGPTGTEGDRPTLLIIEDNRDVISYIESLLQKDYHIETAQNGQTGIEKALEMIPDIIISDVMMPEKDGYAVCQTLKKDERTSHIPIILLTAKATKEDRIEGLREGADAYLVKPFHQEELFIRLEKLIALRRALQESYSGTDLMYKLTHSGSTSTKTATRPSLDEQFLQKLVQVVQEKINDPDLAVIHLCQAVRLSNSQVNRKLKAVTGKTPSQFIRSIRLQKAMELLQTTDLHVSEIAYQLGFNDPNYFTRAFSEEFGCPPNAIRK
jgi:CheY-like chemotaxis protein